MTAQTLGKVAVVSLLHVLLFSACATVPSVYSYRPIIRIEAQDGPDWHLFGGWYYDTEEACQLAGQEILRKLAILFESSLEEKTVSRMEWKTVSSLECDPKIAPKEMVWEYNSNIN